MLVCLKVCQQQEQLPEDAAKDMQNIYNVKIEFVHSLLTKVLNGEAQFFFWGVVFIICHIKCHSMRH